MTKPLIVITGASSEMGLALAFAGEGNPLLLISRHIEPVPELAEHAVIYARVDVADYPAMEQAIRSIAPRSSLAPPVPWSTIPAPRVRATSRASRQRVAATRSM